MKNLWLHQLRGSTVPECLYRFLIGSSGIRLASLFGGAADYRRQAVHPISLQFAACGHGACGGHEFAPFDSQNMLSFFIFREGTGR